MKTFIKRQLHLNHQRCLLEVYLGPLLQPLNKPWQWGPEIQLTSPEAGKCRSQISVIQIYYLTLL